MMSKNQSYGENVDARPVDGLPERLTALESRVDALLRMLEAQEQRLAALGNAPADPVALPFARTEPAGPRPRPAGAAYSGDPPPVLWPSEVRSANERSPVVPHTPTPPNPQTLFTPGPATMRRGPDLESVFGGKILNWVGAVALILGLVFLSRLAWGSGWVTNPMRVCLGMLLGIALVVGGEALRRRGHPSYSYGLTGAGYAALYVSSYAAFGIYHLIGFTSAAVILVAVTAATVAHAIFLNAQPVAFLGLLGGFLTPVVLGGGQSTSGSSAAALFTYIWLLNAGLMAASYARRWTGMKLCALVATHIFFLGWLLTDYQPSMLPTVVVALSAHFVLFAWVPAAWLLALKRDVDGTDPILLLETPAVYAMVLMDLCWRWKSDVGVWFVALAGLYAVFTLLSLRTRTWTAGPVVCLVAVATWLLTLGLIVLLTGNGRMLGLSAEAIVLFWGGCRANSAPLRTAGYILYGVVAVALLAAILSVVAEGLTPSAFSGIEIPCLLAILSALLGEQAARTFSDVLRPEESTAAGLLAELAYLAGLVLISCETALWAEQGRGGVWAWLGVSWAIYALGLLAYGIYAGRRMARFTALGLLAVVIAKVFLYDIWLLDLLYRVLALFTLAGALWAASYLYSRYRDRIHQLVLQEESRSTSSAGGS